GAFPSDQVDLVASIEVDDRRLETVLDAPPHGGFPRLTADDDQPWVAGPPPNVRPDAGDLRDDRRVALEDVGREAANLAGEVVDRLQAIEPRGPQDTDRVGQPL